MARRLTLLGWQRNRPGCLKCRLHAAMDPQPQLVRAYMETYHRRGHPAAVEERSGDAWPDA